MKTSEKYSLNLKVLRGVNVIFGEVLFWFVCLFSKKSKDPFFKKKLTVWFFCTTSDEFPGSFISSVESSFKILTKTELQIICENVRSVIITDRGDNVYNPLFRTLIFSTLDSQNVTTDTLLSKFREIVKHLEVNEKA